MSTTIYSADYRPSSISLFHDSDGYYHLIYMIVNKINNKIYIGKHSTKNPYDDYMGSGKAIKAAIKKYGEHNFEKVIIDCLSTEDKAYLKEEDIVTSEFVDREDTYNQKCGGKGIKSFDMLGKKNHFYGKKHKEETKERMRKNHANFKLGNHPEARKVQKCDLNGNMIIEYACLYDCYTNEKMSNHTLWKYIKSGKPYKGYVYRYAEPSLYSKPYRAKSEETKNKLSKKHKGPSGENHNCSKKVVKVDKDDNIIATYCSIKEAAVMNNFKNPLSIKQRLYNGKPHNGYFYKFAEEYNNE